MHPLVLQNEQLIDIALEFETKVQEGLAAPDRMIRCMPTYISLGNTQLSGSAAVLDLGGSNLRGGIVACENGVCRLVERSDKIKMPWQRNVPFEKDELLDIQSRVLAGLSWEGELPLGYCFSYPAQPTEDRDVKLLKWAKGIDVPGTVGRKIGEMLLSHLENHYSDIHCSGVTVINDTVAALIGGMAGPDTTATIGLIAGTGTNMAATFDPSDMPKLSTNLSHYRQLPVNLESGNFSPPHLTEWDDAIDRASNNPGEQRLEKAISGAYLGQLFKAQLPDSDFDPTTGGAGLVKILEQPDAYSAEWIEAAERAYYRSADLVAAALAGLIRLLQRLSGRNQVRVVAEGALFWGQLQGENRYRNRAAATLEELLVRLDLNSIGIEFFRKERANLIGSALAALS